MSDKKEILERVLLLMKYSNKLTFNENLLVLKEQIAKDFQYEKETEKEEWKPNAKKVKNFLGGELEVPTQTEVFKFAYKFKPNKLYPIDGQEKIGSDIADFVYVKNLKAANPFFAGYFSDNSFDNKKFYYPTKNALTRYFGDSAFEFDIPKGTPKPYDRNVKENEDDWLSDRQQGEELTDKVHTFKPVKKIEKTDINLALSPKANSMHGWKYLPGYYTRDILPNKLVSYVPELWIQYKSPTKLWWDEYGTYVEIVGSIIITIASGGIAATALAAFEITAINATTLTFYVDLVLNGAFNLGIAQMHFNAHDNEAGYISTFFAFLPVLHRFSSGIKSSMIAASIDNEMIKQASKELLEKLPATSLGKDKNLWKAYYSSLSKPTRKVMKWALTIPENEIQPSVKRALTWANKRLLQSQTKGVFSFSKFIFKKGFTGLMKMITQGVVDIKIMEKIESVVESAIGKKLNPAERVSLLSVIANTSIDEQKTYEQASNEYIAKVESGEKTNEEIAKDLSLDVSDESIEQFTKAQNDMKKDLEDDEL
jgi:hypothetical protein